MKGADLSFEQLPNTYGLIATRVAPMVNSGDPSTGSPDPFS